MPSACEADEGGLWNRREPRRAGQCPAPTKEETVSISAVGAAISRPSLLPSREKVPSKGADEGDLLARIIHGGSPKGLPLPKLGKSVLETRRGGACPSRGPVWDRPLRKKGRLLYKP